MTRLNLVEGLNLALDQAMASDDRVLVMGEDVARTGGVFRVTAGLFDKYGDERVIDTSPRRARRGSFPWSRFSSTLSSTRPSNR